MLQMLQFYVSNDVVVSTYKSRLKITESTNLTTNRTPSAIDIDFLITLGVLALLFTFSDGFESLHFMAFRFSSRRLRNWVVKSAGYQKIIPSGSTEWQDEYSLLDIY